MLSAAAQNNSLSSLRESAAARFQNGSVSGSDDEKPEPLSQSPVTDGAKSPPGERARHLTQSKRSSMWAGNAPPQPAASRTSGSEGQRHSMWPGGSPSSVVSSSARRLSLSQHAAPLQSLHAGASQGDSPSSMTAARFQNGHKTLTGSDDEKPEPLSRSPVTGGARSPPGERARHLTQKRGSMWVGAPPQPAASLSSGLAGKTKHHSLVRFA